MSAVLATSSPSALLRRPPTAPAAAPARPTRVRITGPLAEDAYGALEPATGRAAFTVVISQGAGEPDLVATRWVGDGPEAASFAHERAAALRAGDIVEVQGEGLRMRQRHGVLALHVCTTFDVERVVPGNSAEDHS